MSDFILVKKIAASLVLIFFYNINLSFAVEKFKATELKDSIKNETVCNDGSAYTYYLNESFSDKNKNWFIFLYGGGRCTDQTKNSGNCIFRKYHFKKRVTSKYNQSDMDGFGLINSLQKYKRGWNIILLPYCSSDFWTGNMKREIAGEAWQFRGEKIFSSVIDHIFSRSTVGNVDEVILSGSSAGAVGAMFNYAYLRKSLPKVRIRLISDGFMGFPVNSIGKIDYLNKELLFWRNKSSVICGIESLEISECLNPSVYYVKHDVRSLHFIDVLDQSFLSAFLTNNESKNYCQTVAANHELILKNYDHNLKEISSKTKLGLIAPSWGIHGAIFDKNFTYIEKQVLDWLNDRPVFLKTELNSRNLKCNPVGYFHSLKLM